MSRSSTQTTAPRRVTYRLKEFALATGIPYGTVYSRVRAGKIPSVDIGGTLVIPAVYLEALLQQAVPAAPEPATPEPKSDWPD